MAKDPSRTEKATPKRLQKSRSEGNVPRSQEFAKAASIAAGFIILSLWMRFICADLQELMRFFVQVPEQLEITENSLYQLLILVAYHLAIMLLPVLLFIAVIMILILRLQVGKLWSSKIFKPKLSRFNPINGLKRMFFSTQTFIRLFRSLAQALVIGIPPILLIKHQLPFMLQLFTETPEGIAVYILELGQKMVKYALYPICIIALIDLWYTRWSYAENLKMTKSEVKDEHKQSEGDPLIRATIRKKMMDVIVKQMMKNVPKADLIITNPVHLALALRYDADEAPAPVLLAKGANKVAERIKELGREHQIPIRENVPLAQALYKQVEVGDMIPAELFQAVAIMLAQIWKNKPGKAQRKNANSGH